MLSAPRAAADRHACEQQRPADVGGHHHPPPPPPAVGEGAGVERQDEVRRPDERGQHPHLRRRGVERDHPDQRQRDAGDLVAQHRDALRRPVEAEHALAQERRHAVKLDERLLRRSGSGRADGARPFPAGPGRPAPSRRAPYSRAAVRHAAVGDEDAGDHGGQAHRQVSTRRRWSRARPRAGAARRSGSTVRSAPWNPAPKPTPATAVPAKNAAVERSIDGKQGDADAGDQRDSAEEHDRARARSTGCSQHGQARRCRPGRTRPARRARPSASPTTQAGQRGPERAGRSRPAPRPRSAPGRPAGTGAARPRAARLRPQRRQRAGLRRGRLGHQERRRPPAAGRRRADTR